MHSSESSPRTTHFDNSVSSLSLSTHLQYPDSLRALSPRASHVRFLARATLSTSSLRAPRPLSLQYSDLFDERFSTRAPSTAPRSLLSRAPLEHVHLTLSFSFRAPPSSGRVPSLLQSHGLAALPPCLSSLWNQAEEEDAVLPLRDSRGRFGGASRRAPENQAGTEPQQQSARAFWRETSPRPRCISIRPSENVTTRCAFDGECR